MELPAIKPEWRTATVTGLCLSMRQEQDFSALPILADALQDAGCDDDELLARLRGGTADRFASGALVAAVLSDETADAVRWIEEFAAAHDGSMYSDRHSKTYTYAVMIDAAEAWVESRHHLVGGTELEGESVPDEFWERYQLATGKSVPEEHRGSFFSCSC